MTEDKATPTSTTPATASRLRQSLSAFPNLNVLTTLLPSGHDKPLKLAVYNALALLLLFLVMLVVVAVHFVLEPFIRPLLWALLCGSAVHPFKRWLIKLSRSFIAETRVTRTPLTLALCLLPFTICNWLVDFAAAVVLRYAKLLLFVVLALSTAYLFGYYFSLVQFTLNLMSGIINLVTTAGFYLTKVTNNLIVSTLVLGHVTCMLFWWSPRTKPFLVAASPVVWLLAAVHFVKLTGSYGLLAAGVVVGLVFIGVLKKIIRGDTTRGNQEGDEVDGLSSFRIKVINWFELVWPWICYLFSSNHNETEETQVDDETESIESEEQVDSKISDYKSTEFISVGTSPFSSLEMIRHGISRQNSLSSEKACLLPSKRMKSQTFLVVLGWTFLLAQLWFHPRLLLLAPMILLFCIIKWIFLKIQSSQIITTKLTLLKQFFSERQESLVNTHVRTVYNCFLTGDGVITDAIESSLNTLTSLTVIFLMIISVMFAGVFISVQVYGESLHLVNLVGNAVNSTINSNQELSQMMPDSLGGVHHVLDDIVVNAYHYGRDYIKNLMQNTFHSGDTNKTKAIEKQVLEVWDRAYQMWLTSSKNQTEISLQKGPYNWDKLFKALKTLNLSQCFNILRENIDTVMSIFDSIWLLLKGNFRILSGALTAVFSLLLGGGSAIINFLVNTIVFTTALFYLLSSSGDQYKPVQFVNSLLPSSSSGQNAFGRAVEAAVNGVFAASFKMLGFYGLYTWLVHTLFEVDIVYIPSVVAAIFSVVPFLGPYWAFIPAALELWLKRQSAWQALLMVVFALLPVSFVDSTIYSEIQGAGHPYLTGLAIAGGLFYLGLEGALFGPILLCCLFVAVNMFGALIGESGAERGDATPAMVQTPLVTSTRKKAPQIKRLIHRN